MKVGEFCTFTQKTLSWFCKVIKMALSKRDLKIIASFAYTEAERYSTKGAKKNVYDSFETMVEICGFEKGVDIHDYKEAVEKRQPQLRMKV